MQSNFTNSISIIIAFFVAFWLGAATLDATNCRLRFITLPFLKSFHIKNAIIFVFIYYRFQTGNSTAFVLIGSVSAWRKELTRLLTLAKSQSKQDYIFSVQSNVLQLLPYLLYLQILLQLLAKSNHFQHQIILVNFPSYIQNYLPANRLGNRVLMSDFRSFFDWKEFERLILKISLDYNFSQIAIFLEHAKIFCQAKLTLTYRINVHKLISV